MTAVCVVVVFAATTAWTGCTTATPRTVAAGAGGAPLPGTTASAATIVAFGGGTNGGSACGAAGGAVGGDLGGDSGDATAPKKAERLHASKVGFFCVGAAADGLLSLLALARILASRPPDLFAIAARARWRASYARKRACSSPST